VYRLAIKEKLDKKFKKLQKKDKEMLRLIERKVQEVLENPYRFKPLRKPLQNKRRVHVGGSFVLVYEVNKEKRMVTLFDFDHPDNVYKVGI
jgi:YafQ family addiction module toxin component